MPATDSYVRVFPDSTGKYIDADSIVEGAFSVQRQRIRIGGEALGDLATVTNNRLNVNVFIPGTSADTSSNSAGDGLITLTTGPDTLVSISVTSGTYNLTGFNWAADTQCQFSLELWISGILTKTYRTVINSGNVPTDSIIFSSPIQLTGGTGKEIRISGKRLQGSSGSAAAGINGYLT